MFLSGLRMEAGEAVMLKHLEDIINSIREASRYVDEIERLDTTYLRFPINFPVVKKTVALRRFMELLEKRFDRVEFGEINILSNDLKPVKVKPSIKVDTTYIQGNEVLVLKVENNYELVGIIIPLACVSSNCVVELPFHNILRIASVLSWNKEFVKKIMDVINDVNKEVAALLEALASSFAALELLGFKRV